MSFGEDEHAKGAVRGLLQYVGEDPDREGLRETPERYAKALKFWCSGYGQDPGAILKTFTDGSEKYDELVFESNIKFYSLCEHHLAVFLGVVHIGYIPNGRIVGISKLARLVEVFSRRLQVQERMTVQIVDALMEHLKPLGAGVVVRARHMCMESRGVQKQVGVETCALRGVFFDKAPPRDEFLRFVSNADRHEPL
jgi:GTP cyclohydrolase IA